ncbi:MAG: cysteine--tRNA ligase [Anaerolineales bacterium]|nr:cysteine--tRNA ligase [Anaerolineales bacterium]
MKLYNSRTGRVEGFEPLGDEVTLYVCGMTPYDTTHLGHAFTYTANDILIRYLEYQGLAVRYVQNVTDVDDDILGKAEREGEDWKELGNRWTAHFIEDMKALNVLPPDHFPRATDVIDGIIETVEQLLEAGVAYEVEGNVYFEIDGWEPFGKLSKLPKDEMLPIANERGNHPDDPHKRDPLDFVLWQAQKPGEPAWDSPWGKGRPGWHIECSTMATEFLGDTIDIHSGGEDLLFPHHECEIAQVEPVTGRSPFVRFWMHTAMVRHDGEKMSKSLGNLVMARDLLRRWSPDALRLYLGSHHYRTPWEHDEAALARADQVVLSIMDALEADSGDGESVDVDPHRRAFENAMDDDLDTNLAVQALETFAAGIKAAAKEGRELTRAQDTLREMAEVFGLKLQQEDPDPRVIQGWSEHLQRFPTPETTA